MNENIDLTKILEGCPKGTTLYSAVHGEVIFMGLFIADKDYYPIKVLADAKTGDFDTTIWFTKEGRNSYFYNGECTLFPSKDQRDWSKFERFWDNAKLEDPKDEKFDVNTLHPYDKVLARDFLSDDWMADFFEKIEENDVHYNVTCVTCRWVQCIPYNEETKHLLGTKEDCPEYYKWWDV